MNKYYKSLSVFIALVVVMFDGCDIQSPSQLSKITTSDYIRAKCYNSFVEQMGGTCRYINVKAQPDNKHNNRTLDIYYSIIPATDRSTPKKQPIVFLANGFSESSTYGIDKLFQNSSSAHFKLLKHHDYIFVDYRGTGFSTPSAKCQRGNVDFIEDVNKCVDTLPKDVDTKDYTTTYIAYDISKIIKKEHLKKVNLFGVSYGSRVVSSIIRDYPKLVNKAVVEGFYPIEVNGVIQGSEAILQRLSYIRSKYNKVYPKEDFESRLVEYIDKLDKKDRLKRLEGIAWMAFEDKSYKELKKEFDKTRPSIVFGKYHKLKKSKMANKYINEKYNSLKTSYIVPTAILMCEEYVFKDLQSANTFGFGDKILRLTKGYNALWSMPLDKLEGSKIQTHKSAFRDMQPLVSDTPILILSGEWDMQTPFLWAKNAQKHLTNSKHFFFMQKNHSFSMNDKVAIDIVNAFYNTKKLSSLDRFQSKDVWLIKQPKRLETR